MVVQKAERLIIAQAAGTNWAKPRRSRKVENAKGDGAPPGVRPKPTLAAPGGAADMGSRKIDSS